MMRCVIVTGMSGAGKSTALKVLEDDGYFCVDNLPIGLIEQFFGLIQNEKEGGTDRDRVAVGIDIRSGRALAQLGPAPRSGRAVPDSVSGGVGRGDCPAV